MTNILLLFLGLQLLQHQQFPILVNGESGDNSTSLVQNVLPNSDVNTPITNLQTNLTKAPLQEKPSMGSGSNSNTDKILSRKITPTETQSNSKDSIKNSTKTNEDLALVASNVLMNVKNMIPTGPEVNNTKSVNVTSDGSGNGKNISRNISVDANVSTNLAKSGNITEPTVESPIVTINKGNQTESNSIAGTKVTPGTIIASLPTTNSTTTTTTTTPKPKKPSITFGIGDFPHLPGEPPVVISKTPESSLKLPVSSDPIVPPNAQPSQELNSTFNYHKSRDYIVPIMTVLFTIPLAIGVVITTYRRFRDCWSTRHYRRMDFLVDGMYND